MKPEELRQKRVLVVDDDPLMLALLETVLRDMVEVVSAGSGAAALERAQQRPVPDLILLDVSMPEMSGHEVCRRLKAEPLTREIPVVFSTAAGHDEDEAVGFHLGAIDYITKPFRLPVVRARVRAHLETQHLYHQIRQSNLLLDQKVRERTRALEEEMRSRRQAEDRFVHQIYHDPLTGLPNRLLLQKVLAEQIQEPGQRSLGLMLLSLAGFHEINNTLGYETGSQLLKHVAERLGQEAARLPGMVVLEQAARPVSVAVLSGVNFACLLDAEGDALLQAAEALLEAIDQPFEFEGMTLNIGAQVGVAVWPEHGRDADDLLRHAHIALEEAASSDKRALLYVEDINRYSARRLSLMGELRSAIQRDDLRLALQPQLELATGKVVGVEALLRWQHPRLGFVPPDEFIPLAEQTGVIRPLTAWVLREAARSCREFLDAGLPLRFSVNLSARNLRETDLLAQILELIQEYRLPPDMLLLEVTETAVMQNAEVALKSLSLLDQAGVRSSIDDFGTGYSSLGYLKRLPVREIKIDRSFVMEMMTDKDDRVIVETIVAMGRKLGMQVVAEGVENSDSLAALAALGCDLAQGYHLSKPVFAEDLRRWLTDGPYAAGAQVQG